MQGFKNKYDASGTKKIDLQKSTKQRIEMNLTYLCLWVRCALWIHQICSHFQPRSEQDSGVLLHNLNETETYFGIPKQNCDFVYQKMHV